MAAPPADPGSSGFFAQGVGGVRLYRHVWAPLGAPRAVVMIVHGLKDHGARYDALATELARRGFAVYAVDLRGHGRSEGRRAYVRSFDDLLSDVGNLLGSVQKERPGLPVFLLGHSMGGAISTRFVIERPPVFAGLILTGAALRVTDDISPRLVRVTKLLGRILPGLRVLKAPDELFSRDPVTVRAMAEDPLIEHRPGPARTAAQLLLAMDTIDAGMERVTVPLLVLHGAADRLTNPEGSRELHRRAGSTDKRLTLYDGYYHDLLHDLDQDRVQSDVVAWIEARAPPR